MKIFTFLSFFLFSTMLAFSQEYDPMVENIIGEVNQDSLVFQLRNFSGEDPVVVNGTSTVIEHRVSAWDNDLAADYLIETLEAYGLEVEDQIYSSGGRNVLAVQEGSMYPDEYVMICAHYDAVDFYCADDNASGSVAVLEAARIFTQHEFEYSVIYALWDEEEIGLVGSNYYATQAASNGDVIHAVINLDMIAWDSDDDMVAEIHSSYSANSDELSDYMLEVDDLYSLAVNPVVQIPGTTASDHSRFWNNGYAAVLVIEEYYGGDFNPYYHTEDDRISILNLTYFFEMTKLCIGTLASLAGPVIETSVESNLVLNSRQLSNYPNPVIETTTITYYTDQSSDIRLTLHNSVGAVVRVLDTGQKSVGTHELQLDVRGLNSGIYVLRLQHSNGIETGKMIVR
jgi:hypothetical protein